ncbi:hypothetical protein IWX90DRAFT_8718 [Phyllosticta citrichinensis]|uniref:Uncharacterized protein n=1 Tax=Phyllosticta citrichinensis TaxID=1130410 RepID=A0ABR1Y5R2_9PEZI
MFLSHTTQALIGCIQNLAPLLVDTLCSPSTHLAVWRVQQNNHSASFSFDRGQNLAQSKEQNRPASDRDYHVEYKFPETSADELCSSLRNFPSFEISLSTEAIIALVALIVSASPTVLVLYQIAKHKRRTNHSADQTCAFDDLPRQFPRMPPILHP